MLCSSASLCSLERSLRLEVPGETMYTVKSALETLKLKVEKSEWIYVHGVFCEADQPGGLVPWGVGQSESWVSGEEECGWRPCKSWIPLV